MVRLIYNGQMHNIKTWASLIGIKPNTLLHRLYRGWSIQRTLTTK